MTISRSRQQLLLSSSCSPFSRGWEPLKASSRQQGAGRREARMRVMLCSIQLAGQHSQLASSFLCTCACPPMAATDKATRPGSPAKVLWEEPATTSNKLPPPEVAPPSPLQRQCNWYVSNTRQVYQAAVAKVDVPGPCVVFKELQAPAPPHPPPPHPPPHTHTHTTHHHHHPSPNTAACPSSLNDGSCQSLSPPDTC